jgi:ribosomal protein S18 acetylase RimI-like enzyme
VDEIGSTPQPKHIEIQWFGVHSEYQGEKDDDGHSVALLIYATVEEAALAHPESQDDMPFTLACDVENAHGQLFWERLGYRVVPEPDLKVEDGRYYRMVR